VNKSGGYILCTRADHTCKPDNPMYLVEHARPEFGETGAE